MTENVQIRTEREQAELDRQERIANLPAEYARIDASHYSAELKSGMKQGAYFRAHKPVL